MPDLVPEIARVNPHLTEAQIEERITRDATNPSLIKEINFSMYGAASVERTSHPQPLGVTALPPCFGRLSIGGDLLLNNNQLTSLPNSMGSIQVAGNLILSSNPLHSLPKSMQWIRVSGHLYLLNTDLDPMPTKASFPFVQGTVATDKGAFTENFSQGFMQQNPGFRA